MTVLEERQKKIRIQKDILCYLAQNEETEVTSFDDLLANVSELMKEIHVLCQLSRKNAIVLFPNEYMAKFCSQYLEKELPRKNIMLEGSSDGLEMRKVCRYGTRSVLCLHSKEAWKKWIFQNIDMLIIAGMPETETPEEFDFLMSAAKYKLDLNVGNRVIGIFANKNEWIKQKTKGIEKTNLLKDVSLFLNLQ